MTVKASRLALLHVLEDSTTVINAGPAFDPFADAEAGDSPAVKGTKKNQEEYVHVRVQQYRGRKKLTTVQGLKTDKIDLNKVLKAVKKEFCCNGTLVEDEEMGQVIQLQGDQRKNLSDFLVKNKIVGKDVIKVHGF